jgi:diguanylate cyclase (GGDEF)-like protein/PAS domain S-box-containing protein
MNWQAWFRSGAGRPSGRRPVARDRRFERLVDRAVGGVLLCDAEGTIRETTTAACEILGLSRNDLAGASFFDLIYPEDRDQMRTAVAALVSADTEMHSEPIRVLRRDGALLWLAVSARSMLADPDIGALVFTVDDITSRRQHEGGELALPVLFDKLTGLPNRALLADRLERAVLHAARAKEPLAVLLVNVERFRDVNAALGHTIGDAVLRLVAERLQGTLRASDTLARLIGDEFVALLPCGDDEGALVVASRIEQALEEPFVLDQHRIALSVTMGISFYPRHGRNGEELLQHADVALQNARAQDVTTAVYRSDEDAHTAHRLGMRAELRDAIEHDGLTLHYQPKLTLRTDEIAEVEALMRWIHPAHGFVPPSEFIPIAERWNTIRPLTLWALRTAIRQSRAWDDRPPARGRCPRRLARDASARTSRLISERRAWQRVDLQSPWQGDACEVSAAVEGTRSDAGQPGPVPGRPVESDGFWVASGSGTAAARAMMAVTHSPARSAGWDERNPRISSSVAPFSTAAYGVSDIHVAMVPIAPPTRPVPTTRIYMFMLTTVAKRESKVITV